MTYPSEQQPAGYQDPSYQVSGQPAGPGYPTPGYPPYGYPVVAVAPTNGLAIASLVVSIVGALGLCLYGLGGYFGVVGAILGHVSRRQIRERGENGDGMALAGIIVGWITTGIAVLATIAIVIFIVVIANQEPSTYDGPTPN
jgi:hypothetical protein